MTDISISWSQAYASGDWSLTFPDPAHPGLGDLTTGNDLESSVLVSLFSDRVATPDFKPIDGDPRGWWADTFRTDPLGSSLWQLNRAKISNRAVLLRQAQQFTQDALAWMPAGGYSSKPVVTTQFLSPTMLGLGVTIAKPPSAASYFSYAWPVQA